MARNRDEARTYPEPVSDLYRAGTRVAEHLGRDREVELYVYRILAALRAGLPVEDHRHFTARLEIARSLAALGQPEIARRELRRLAEVARAGGREDVANLAELRSLWLDYMETPHGPARRRLLEMSRWTDPQRALLAYGAKTLLIRIYSREGDDERADALIAAMGGGETRRLLYSPPYQLVQQTNVDGNAHRASAVYEPSGLKPANLAERLTDKFDDKWIDVGFWVQPDGRVDDLQLLRRGPGGGGWAAPLLESIRGRRYSPGRQSRPTGSSATPIPRLSQHVDRLAHPAPLPEGAGRISRPDGGSGAARSREAISPLQLPICFFGGPSSRRRMTRFRISVMSSIAKRMPSRPRP